MTVNISFKIYLIVIVHVGRCNLFSFSCMKVAKKLQSDLLALGATELVPSKFGDESLSATWLEQMISWKKSVVQVLTDELTSTNNPSVARSGDRSPIPLPIVEAREESVEFVESSSEEEKENEPESCNGGGDNNDHVRLNE